jgi:hypothetical protein
MDYNSKELYLAFSRRKEIIKDLINQGIDEIKEESDICDWTKEEFITEVCWQVSDNFEEEINTDIIHSWVRRNFIGYINKSYYDLIKDCNNNDEDYYGSQLYGVDNN